LFEPSSFESLLQSFLLLCVFLQLPVDILKTAAKHQLNLLIALSGDFLVRSSQLVNGPISTAVAVLTATSSTIPVVRNFMFI